MASYQSVWCGYYPNMMPYLTGQPFGYPYYSQDITQPVFYNSQAENKLTSGYNPVPMNQPSYWCPPVTNQYPQQAVYLSNNPTMYVPQFQEQSVFTVPRYEPNFRQKLNNENGCHRVVIQGSNINYVDQNTASATDQPTNRPHPKVKRQTETENRLLESGLSFDTNFEVHATTGRTEHMSRTQTKSNHPTKADFTNLDLLSSVSLLETSKSKTDAPKIMSDELFTETESVEYVSVKESNPPCCDVSPLPVSALGLVSVSLIRKPTVWLNVTLQVDTSSGVKPGQPAAQYRSLMTNVLTELYFPPKLSPPRHLHRDKMAATANYDERGRLTVLEVEFITAGIYKVEDTNNQEGNQRKSTRKAVTLFRLESLESLSAKSQYLILGDLCAVPRTFLKCHRNARPLQKKISEYLYSREFKKYTLPLLLKNGEEDVWTSSLKVPRTRSRVSDYEDLANGDQSLKRKYSSNTLLPLKSRKLTKASSVSSICSSSPDRSDESAVNSPCPSPSSSISSISSFQMSDLFCEDSCDSLTSNHSEPPVLIKEKTIEIKMVEMMSSPPRLRPVTKCVLTRSKQKQNRKTVTKL